MSSIIEGFLTELKSLATSLPPQKSNLVEKALQIGFPTKKEEEWKYTSFERVLREGFTGKDGANTSVLNAETLGNSLEEFKQVKNKVVLLNGVVQAQLSSLPSYVQLAEPKEGLEKSPTFFGTLNSALAKERIEIEVKKAEEEVFYILQFSSGEGEELYHPQIEINLGVNAELKVVEVQFGDAKGTVWHNSLRKMNLAKDAKLEYVLLQADSFSTHHVGSTNVSVSKNAVFTMHTHTLSGGMVRNDLYIGLDEAECEGNMYGLYFCHGEMHVDNHTVVDHRFPKAQSNELYKGILGGESTGVFNGKIFVRQDAQQTNAFQSNRNLLLSDTATINTKPQLEIWADDVKCSHGATSGRLDEESLFYLKSRGLSESSAKRMLLEAFAEELIVKLPGEESKEFIRRQLNNYL